MPVLIVASKLDPAAMNIAGKLRELRNFQPAPESPDSLLRAGDVYLKYVDSEGIHTDRIDVQVKFDAVIFASRHRSESKEPTLTTHWTGNATREADFGGKPKTLSLADPPRLRAALLALDKARDKIGLNYTVTLEATHHGPTNLDAPTLFVEIGSTEREWQNTNAAAVASEAIWEAATSPAKGTGAVGFGGGHYCNKQCIAIRESGYAFGHIFSKYFFDEYDEEMVRMAFKRTLGECRTAVIDWKGIRGPQRTMLLDLLKKMDIELVRV